jgi:predicted ATP-binding protein involved in virulence
MSTALRLDQLSLHNFRCFADCSLDLHEDLTVFVAENGRGKTALLDGIGVALGTFVDAVSGTRQFHGFERADVRLIRSEETGMTPALPTRFVADGYVAGQKVHWSRSLQKYSLRARSSTKDAKDILELALSMREGLEHSELQNSQVQLPLVAFYGTGRLWSEHRLTEGKKQYAIDSRSRLSGYTDCLSSSSSFKGVVAWYENKMNEIGDAKFATHLSDNLSLIAAIKEAVRVVLEPTGWQELNWDSNLRSIVVEHPNQGRLPLSALSDGVRNMIALVADVAHRCARLNPHLREEAARRTAGVLLIDEVDMHLHPRWQQLVVDLLRKAFPALQLIISTHSPHVLSTVGKESIRVIRLVDGETSIDTPTIQTRGVMSADVLASIMGVDPVPHIEEATWLTHYRALIEDGEAENTEGQELRRKLVAHFGEGHPLMADCDRLIRFQAFRLKRKSPGEGS